VALTIGLVSGYQKRPEVTNAKRRRALRRSGPPPCLALRGLSNSRLTSCSRRAFGTANPRPDATLSVIPRFGTASTVLHCRWRNDCEAVPQRPVATWWLGTDHLDAQEDGGRTGGRTVCWVYVIDDTPRPIEERVNCAGARVARLKTSCASNWRTDENQGRQTPRAGTLDAFRRRQRRAARNQRYQERMARRLKSVRLDQPMKRFAWPW